MLKPGGRVAVSSWGSRSRCGWAEIFPIVERRVASDVCPLFFQLGSADNLRQALERSRFGDIEVVRVSSPLVYESAADACGAAFAGGPVALAYSRFNPATRAEAEAEYLASIEPWREGGIYRIPGEFVVARAFKAAA